MLSARLGSLCRLGIDIFIFLLIFTFFGTASSAAQEIAITIDDFRLNDGPLLSAIEKDERILDSLAKNDIDIALFVIGNEAVKPLNKERLSVWDQTSHIIANHTYGHRRPYDRTTFEEFSDDILKAHEVLSGYRNFRPYFRFPLLKEGNTREKRDLIRTFLKDWGYRQGYVTIDTSDWYISSRMIDRLSLDPKADLEPYKNYYLEHLWERAQFYDGLSQQVLGRSVKHTLLIHHNLLNAIFLSDVIEMFRSKGWAFVSAREAFDDPVFQREPDIVPAGESILWGLAKESGKLHLLRYPSEDAEYQKDAMDRLGL
jgi:peptidoglycan-N-acetylglucosamine deacetylase